MPAGFKTIFGWIAVYTVIDEYSFDNEIEK